jgi:hypothetical protein
MSGIMPSLCGLLSLSFALHKVFTPDSPSGYSPPVLGVPALRGDAPSPRVLFLFICSPKASEAVHAVATWAFVSLQQTCSERVSVEFSFLGSDLELF